MSQDAGSVAQEVAPPVAKAEAVTPASGPLSALLDIAMPVIIEIGRTSLTVSEVLELEVGSVVQLECQVGEPVDVLVSDRKLAEGEIVVVEDHLGVRITRLLSGQLPEARR